MNDEDHHRSKWNRLLVRGFCASGDPVSGRGAGFEDLIGTAEIGPVLAQFSNLRADGGAGVEGIHETLD